MTKHNTHFANKFIVADDDNVLWMFVDRKVFHSIYTLIIIIAVSNFCVSAKPFSMLHFHYLLIT